MSDFTQTPAQSTGAEPETPPDVRPDPKPTAKTFVQRRLQSLDVYRGMIMILLAFNGFGLAKTAENFLDVDEEKKPIVWQAVYYQFSHVQWVGCSIWDMIQPSFMFMVGVAMAFSYANRRNKGHSYPWMLLHAMIRSVVLILLGIFLISNGRDGTNWSLMNVLTQIGLGYVFLFLLWDRHVALQSLAAAVLLVGTWVMYEQYPHAGIDIEKGAPEVEVKQKWAERYLDGVSPAWHKNANVGHAVDVKLLNLAPRKNEFVGNNGGYQSINFIPSLATMIFGLMCGGLLRSNHTASRKILIMLTCAVAGVAAGAILHITGVCPLVKRIWTPSWTLFSTGLCLFIILSLYGLIDVLGWRWWTFPFVVVGVNSIAIYCMGQLLKPWTARTWQTHCGPEVFTGIADFLWLGADWEPFVRFTMIGLTFWFVCLWMYLSRIFVRI